MLARQTDKDTLIDKTKEWQIEQYNKRTTTIEQKNDKEW